MSADAGLAAFCRVAQTPRFTVSSVCTFLASGPSAARKPICAEILSVFIRDLVGILVSDADTWGTVRVLAGPTFTTNQPAALG